uniref:Uncharacterized protein n=1 Tax=Leptospirillum ferriphilum TaxID=178606 RepID=A0A7C3R5V7_9BACT
MAKEEGTQETAPEVQGQTPAPQENEEVNPSPGSQPEEYAGEPDWSSWMKADPEPAPPPVDVDRIRIEEQNRILSELLRNPNPQPEPEVEPVEKLKGEFSQRFAQMEMFIAEQADRTAWENIKRDLPQAAGLEKEVEREVKRLRGLGMPVTREQTFYYLVGQKAVGNLKKPAQPKKAAVSGSNQPSPGPSERGAETLEELENRLRGVPI